MKWLSLKSAEFLLQQRNCEVTMHANERSDLLDWYCAIVPIASVG